MESDLLSHGPVLFLTIRNGAGHTRSAEAIAEALTDYNAAVVTQIIDVADYMTLTARFTHVTLWSWLVRNTPSLWARIDGYQKRQSTTSPAWYYRRHCRRLFDLVRGMKPAAIVATEVGCCEIAALLVRDLGLGCPLIAVNGEYDADRAWVRPEVTAYSVPTATVADEVHGHGAPRDRVHVWGVPIDRRFNETRNATTVRAEVCKRLGLDPGVPLVVVSGGGECIGWPPDTILAKLLQLRNHVVNIVVLVGRNNKMKRRCDRAAARFEPSRVRVLEWTRDVPELMAAADLLVSKPGHTFDEALAAGVPMVSLPPPPGSDVVKYRLLDAWGVGRAVADLDALARTVHRLLLHADERKAMQQATVLYRDTGAAARIAHWILQECALATLHQRDVVSLAGY
jgi:processive 1,2-diacylglycerol beta-glucosyltransferase